MAVSERDRAVAEEIAAEVRETGKTWRKVTTLLSRYGIYRLTINGRARIMESLTGAGVAVDPTLFDVERFGTVRLSLLADPGTSRTDDEPQHAASRMVRASIWRQGLPPAEVDLASASQQAGTLWLDVDAGDVEPDVLQAVLADICGPDVSMEVVEDLLQPDEFPGVRHHGAFRTVSAVSVATAESEASESDPGASKAGTLIFQPVEFVAADRWLITCWQGEAIRPDDLFEVIAERWERVGASTPGDLGLLILHELARTYTDARRELYAWLETWELDFVKRRHKTETATLEQLRSLIATFRKHLTELHRSGLSEHPDRIWFSGVTRLDEAERVDDLIDRALRDLRALGEALLASISLTSSINSAEQTRRNERFQQLVAAGAGILLVPTLVATIYGANTRVPGQQAWEGFAAMIVVMITTAALTIVALKVWFDRDRDREESNAENAGEPDQDDVTERAAGALPSASSGMAPVLVLYNHVARDPNSRTPILLRVFAQSDGLTPEEIGERLAKTNGGVPLTKHQARAILRNLSRTQGHLHAAGRLQREVLQKDFTRYDVEGAGRYGLSKENRNTLRRYLEDHGTKEP